MGHIRTTLRRRITEHLQDGDPKKHLLLDNHVKRLSREHMVANTILTTHFTQPSWSVLGPRLPVDDMLNKWNKCNEMKCLLMPSVFRIFLPSTMTDKETNFLSQDANTKWTKCAGVFNEESQHTYVPVTDYRMPTNNHAILPALILSFYVWYFMRIMSWNELYQ